MRTMARRVVVSALFAVVFTSSVETADGRRFGPILPWLRGRGPDGRRRPVVERNANGPGRNAFSLVHRLPAAPTENGVTP